MFDDSSVINTIVSKSNPLKHYIWGENCDGWNLVDHDQLSIKQERMPGGTSETLHYHQYAQQFFYILSGTATFELEGTKIFVQHGEGLKIEAGKKHRILNETAEAIEFLLCSHPSTANDRINL